MESSKLKLPPAICRGATLIEVLVALSILTLGLAGLNALQLKTLEQLRSVVYQSRAALYAADMAERLRGQGANGAPAEFGLEQWQADIEASLPAGKGEVCLDSTPRDGSADAPACDVTGNAWAIKLWWDEDRDGIAERRHAAALRR